MISESNTIANETLHGEGPHVDDTQQEPQVPWADTDTNCDELVPLLKLLWDNEIQPFFATYNESSDVAPDDAGYVTLYFFRGFEVEEFLEFATSRAYTQAVARRIAGVSDNPKANWEVNMTREVCPIRGSKDDRAVNDRFDIFIRSDVTFPWADMYQIFGPEIFSQNDVQRELGLLRQF